MKLTTNLKKKINKSREFLKNSLIYFVYHNMKIDNNLIFIESKDGRDFVGNMFRIVEELSSGEYGNYKIYVCIIYLSIFIHIFWFIFYF